MTRQPDSLPLVAFLPPCLPLSPSPLPLLAVRRIAPVKWDGRANGNYYTRSNVTVTKTQSDQDRVVPFEDNYFIQNQVGELSDI